MIVPHCSFAHIPPKKLTVNSPFFREWKEYQRLKPPNPRREKGEPDILKSGGSGKLITFVRKGRFEDGQNTRLRVVA